MFYSYYQPNVLTVTEPMHTVSLGAFCSVKTICLSDQWQGETYLKSFVWVMLVVQNGHT